MASQKPISTISYNSESFLREKLDDWLKAHIICAYQYICHKGEDGDKDHIHLRIEPNKRIDPMNLSEDLREFVSGHDKPLGCRPWRPSKEEDWLLYAVHDETYLKIKYGGAEKGEKIPYSISDIKVPFDYDIEVAFIRAKSALKHTAPSIINEIRNGVYISDLIGRGENIYLINAVLQALSKTDYKSAIQELSEKNSFIDKLLNALENAGLTYEENDSGAFVIIHKD